MRIEVTHCDGMEDDDFLCLRNCVLMWACMGWALGVEMAADLTSTDGAFWGKVLKGVLSFEEA